MMALFRLEAILLLRNRMFVAMLVLLAAFAALAEWQGGALARAQAAAIERAAEVERASDAEALATAARIKAGEIDPPWWQNPLNVQAWSYAMVRHVSLPPEPLAGVAIADADLKPFLFKINPHPPDRWSNKASELTPSVAAYGGFDLVDLILMLTPLVILIAFADVIRDRDGTDRQRLGIVRRAGETGLLAARLAPRAAVAAARMLEERLIRVYAASDPLERDLLLGALGRGELLITPTNLLIQRDVDRRRAAPRKAEENARGNFERRTRMLALGSPTLIACDALHEIAGRGWRRRAAFDAQVGACYADLQTRFTPLLMRRAVSEDVLLPPAFEFDLPDHNESGSIPENLKPLKLSGWVAVWANTIDNDGEERTFYSVTVERTRKNLNALSRPPCVVPGRPADTDVT